MFLVFVFGWKVWCWTLPLPLACVAFALCISSYFPSVSRAFFSPLRFKLLYFFIVFFSLHSVGFSEFVLEFVRTFFKAMSECKFKCMWHAIIIIFFVVQILSSTTMPWSTRDGRIGPNICFISNSFSSSGSDELFNGFHYIIIIAMFVVTSSTSSGHHTVLYCSRESGINFRWCVGCTISTRHFAHISLEFDAVMENSSHRHGTISTVRRDLHE